MDSRNLQETPEEGRRMYQQKRCKYNNDEVENSPNIRSERVYYISIQKFR